MKTGKMRALKDILDILARHQSNDPDEDGLNFNVGLMGPYNDITVEVFDATERGFKAISDVHKYLEGDHYGTSDVSSVFDRNGRQTGYELNTW